MIYDPEQARRYVRSMAHPNRESEDTAVRRVDAAVFDRVRKFERTLYEQSQEFNARDSALQKEAGAVSDTILQLGLDIQSGRVKVDQATAHRWLELQDAADSLSDRLARSKEEAAHLANKLESPEAAYSDLLNRFPGLARGFVI